MMLSSCGNAKEKGKRRLSLVVERTEGRWIQALGNGSNSRLITRIPRPQRQNWDTAFSSNVLNSRNRHQQYLPASD
ncbi:hypothetical protein [Microcoleus sp. FACHB-68]|uniref:hypothetical protein n=1 Tax=Microcoleus sp. FACHB-68 TaxID=2692826 RepID=UPI001688C2DD|nr:hypothetical protein [Microcoleus sp. FACHB-68]MBD1939838.1 hypothetical protein [Microcoleus sp. FACHB-68]